MNQRFEIGTTYKSYRDGRYYTIVDVHKTYNSAGKMIALSYVTEHEFLGQKVGRHGVTDTEIARSGVTPRNGIELPSDFNINQ